MCECVCEASTRYSLLSVVSEVALSPQLSPSTEKKVLLCFWAEDWMWLGVTLGNHHLRPGVLLGACLLRWLVGSSGKF